MKNAPLGVNVAGYLDTESGMGEAARGSIRSIEAAGIPVALNNVESRLRKADRSYAAAFVADNPHPFNLVHLNADNMGWFAAGQGGSYFRIGTRSAIGSGNWRVSRRVDPVFRTSSTRCGPRASSSATVVRRLVTGPVVHMPLPSRGSPSGFGRSHFGSPARGTVFLYMFDVSSQAEAQNPIGAIEAFRRARFARDEAVLVLKFTNAEYDREAVRRLHEGRPASTWYFSTAIWIGRDLRAHRRG